ncbi:DUF1194 domain-containing protein [Sulfitobacter porphyrae]|uniref:DUF1194 domain-containing protein n=1 Tax=Sulfitobacter porphyrae TaxID=1246864 RepID=A0ABW2B1Y1_9RHOB
MAEGVRRLTAQSDCWKRTLDISGDGKSNLGPRPRTVRTQLEDSGVTINALVIGVDNPAPPTSARPRSRSCPPTSGRR